LEYANYSTAFYVFIEDIFAETLKT